MLEDIHDIRPPVMTGMDPGLVRALLWGAGGDCALRTCFFDHPVLA